MSNASTRAKLRYNEKTYSRITVSVAKALKVKYQAHADKAGESLAGFVKRAIEGQIERDEMELSKKTDKAAAPQ